MKDKHEKYLHAETTKTFKLDAGTKKYHCLFFCQCLSAVSVVEPVKRKDEETEPLQAKLEKK